MKIQYLAGLLGLSALVVLAYFVVSDQRKKQAQKNALLYQQTFEAYQKGEFEQAAVLIQGHREELVNEPEGCELMISVLAMRRSFEDLRQTAQRCLESGKADGIAQEAFAYSMSELGQNQEAIRWLLSRDDKRDSHERASVALARLYAREFDWSNSRRYFLRAVQNSDIWSIWLSMILKYEKPMLDDATFIADLVTAVTAKPRQFAALEEKLLNVAMTAAIAPAKIEELRQHIARAEASRS